VADNLAAAVAAALRTNQWGTNPHSAHQRHTYHWECAVCTGDLDRIAVVAATVLTAEVDASVRAVAAMRGSADLDTRLAEISGQRTGWDPGS
jgi:hypothetical protein